MEYGFVFFLCGTGIFWKQKNKWLELCKVQGEVKKQRGANTIQVFNHWITWGMSEFLDIPTTTNWLVISHTVNHVNLQKGISARIQVKVKIRSNSSKFKMTRAFCYNDIVTVSSTQMVITVTQMVVTAIQVVITSTLSGNSQFIQRQTLQFVVKVLHGPCRKT